ncbi:MAG: hypothetical protein JSS34_06750 [Proteobacteria bacterium]|nr:hypothetical protein [Pseudomonadota bacterium]
MKLYLNALYKDPPPSLKAVLLSSFEEEVLDASLSTLLESVYNKNQDRSISRLPATLLKTDPNRLLEILSSPPLFGPPPLLIIEKLTEASLNSLETFLEHLPNCPFFIMTAGYLKATSSLRKFCETSKDIGFIALYAPTTSQIEADIKALLIRYGHTPEPALLRHLVHHYQEKTHLIKSELVPFCLYFEKPTSLKLSDHLTFMNKTLSTEAHCLESFLLKRKDLIEGMPQLSIISFLRLLNFHILRLLEIRPNFSGTSGILKFPHLALKDKALYEEALRKWTTKELFHVLNLLKTLEIEAKRGSLQESDMMLRRLIQVYA